MKFIFFLFSFCFFFSFAAKSESYIWGDFNGWEVGVNSGTNFGCYAMSPNYEDGSLLKIGYILHYHILYQSNLMNQLFVFYILL